jgi:hypothetical protein
MATTAPVTIGPAPDVPPNDRVYRMLRLAGAVPPQRFALAAGGGGGGDVLAPALHVDPGSVAGEAQAGPGGARTGTDDDGAGPAGRVADVADADDVGAPRASESSGAAEWRAAVLRMPRLRCADRTRVKLHKRGCPRRQRVQREAEQLWISANQVADLAYGRHGPSSRGRIRSVRHER